MTNLEKIAYLVSELFKVHLWNAETKDERYAQNNFIGRIKDAIVAPVAAESAAKLLDWEVTALDGEKVTLRTVMYWWAADVKDNRARLDALSAQVASSSAGVQLTVAEQADIYREAVEKSLPMFVAREVEK